MLSVSPELLDLGLSTAVVIARGIDANRPSRAFIEYRRRCAGELASYWKNRSISQIPAFREYERLHRLFGVEDEPAAPEKLLRFVRRNYDFTGAGVVVDCYNLVSAKTLLSIGAHDLARLQAPVVLRRVENGDTFVPLNETAHVNCQGEYAYVATGGQIICRMEVLQGKDTRVEATSRDVVFFLQNNQRIGIGDLLTGSWLLVEILERYCGCKAELVEFQEAPAHEEP